MSLSVKTWLTKWRILSEKHFECQKEVAGNLQKFNMFCILKDISLGLRWKNCQGENLDITIHTSRYIRRVWATSWENLSMPYANNKGADQPAHPRSLISAFVIRSLDSIIPLLGTADISRPYLASAAEQAGLSLNWSETPKTDFLMTCSYRVRFSCGNSIPGLYKLGSMIIVTEQLIF